ncbi:MAG: GMC family oxidoreductase N-terminal domain-containing protein, partial [Bacteroidota bacterium]|nr:GMC family oxidoreductase N-terminal domain-containing protein [Bacteroidota bacterium]
MIYDFIVIGSGFGGSVASLRLVEKGYKVLTIEQGKRYNPEDFPKTNWNLPKYLWIPALRFFGFQKISFFSSVSILSGTGVGGGSLVYANTLYKPPDSFFSNRGWSRFGDWKSILEPFYERASFMLGRRKYTRMNHEDITLKEVAGDMNSENTFDTVHVGVNLDDSSEEDDPYFGGLGPKRGKCTECGGCMVGCRENAKNSLDRNYLWLAEKAGLEILPETKAEKITYEDGLYQVETKKLTSLLSSKRKLFKARGLILAAGTLGTLELLLKQKYRYGTLPHLSEKLGYELRTNAETLCAVSGAKMKINNGLAITSSFSPDPLSKVEIVKYPDNSNAMKWFFGLSADGATTPFRRSLNLFRATLMHPVQFLKTAFNFHWSSNLVILLVMQTIDNSMRMVWRKTTFGGKMKIDNSGQNKVPAYIPVGQEVMRRFSRKVEGISQNILLEVFFNRPTTAHILGGCPMSLCPDEGVVDPCFRVYGYPDFYITDGSVIQGNIGVNPSL